MSHSDQAPGRSGADDSAEISEIDVPKIGQKARSLEAAAFAGAAYAVLSTAGLVLLRRFPSLDQSDAEITAWFEDATHKGWLILGLNMVAVSSIAFLWFVAVIRRRLGDLEDRFFGTVFFGSSIVYVALWLVGAAALAAPAVSTSVLDGGSITEASASLAAGIGVALLLIVAPRVQAVFVITTSTLIFRSRVLPRWLAIVGYAMGVGMFLFPLIMESLGLAFPLWVFIVSIVIFFHRPTAKGDPKETSATAARTSNGHRRG